MLDSVNLQEKLLEVRDKQLRYTSVLSWVQKVFNEVDVAREKTLQKLRSSENAIIANHFEINRVDVHAIFHISQIRKLCVDYRLRFLDAKHFKGEYPSEVISKIHQLEQEHQTTLGGFKIAAPSILFRLKKADDPLLFVPMGNDYYYLIHKWGNDVHPLRKLKYWSIKNVGNLAFVMFVASLILTATTHTFFFKDQSSFGYVLMLFLFYFKGIVGLGLFFGIASGKNFSEYCWQSKHDKIC